MIVVDTNVMARLVVGGEDGAEAAQLFEQDNDWAAPSLLLSELRNVLLGFVRKGAVTPEQAKALSDDALACSGRSHRQRKRTLGDRYRVGVRSYSVRRGVCRPCTDAGRPAGYVGRWTMPSCRELRTWLCRCRHS